MLPRLALGDPALAGRLLLRSLSPPLYRKLGVVLRRDKPVERGLREVVKALTDLRQQDSRGSDAADGKLGV